MNFKFRFDLFFQSRGGGGRKKRGGGNRAARRKASTPRALHPPPSFYISFWVARDVVGTAAREFLPSSRVMISQLSFFSLSFFPFSVCFPSFLLTTSRGRIQIRISCFNPIASIVLFVNRNPFYQYHGTVPVTCQYSMYRYHSTW